MAYDKNKGWSSLGGMSSRSSVVFLVVDALGFNSLEREIGGEAVMPFLNSWRAQGRSWEEAFSLAPYTEAALVSLLGGEKTLEGGGYLFGNGACRRPLLKRYEQKGYRTLLGYSPYVFSESYLAGVTDYYHTRLYSIAPLFVYRLDHYADILRRRSLTKVEVEACRLLLDEGLRTWVKQLEDLESGSKSAVLIMNRVTLPTVKHVLGRVSCGLAELNEHPDSFIRKVLREGHSHELWHLSCVFNGEAKLPLADYLRETYSSKLAAHSGSFVSNMLRQPLNLRYLLATVKEDNFTLKNTRGLLRNYKALYSNHDLVHYFEELQGGSKVEASAGAQFRLFLHEMSDCETAGDSFCAYIQIQDFHLPSIFHSFDSSSAVEVNEEMNEALTLLSKVDGSYRGNIMADLSARYCDSKIKSFVDEIWSVLEDCMIVITADHGFPSYYDPPRPMTYNQTYAEAFHVPFLVLGSAPLDDLLTVKNRVISNSALVDMLTRSVLGEKKCEAESGFVISEYAGPGCPDLAEKAIWYTYIDEDYRISARCSLSQRLGVDNIDTIVNRKLDPKELFNVRGQLEKGNSEMKHRISRIVKRHDELREKYSPEDFLQKVQMATEEASREAASKKDSCG